MLYQARKHYDALLELQGGHCALCPSVAKARRLHLDHDHKTMVVRGLLCWNCNRSLPSRLDSAWLRAAADYLDDPPYARLKENE